MSNLAESIAAPLRRRAERIRHLEVAPTAAQRRARPRLIYAVIVVGGAGAILLGQLLLSIATADGAYRISALQTQQRDYSRQQAALDESISVLRSTQNLTRDAEGLGMVASGDPVFLNVATGAVTGTATDSGGTLTGSGNLVANALLKGSAIDPASADAQQAAADAAAQALAAQTPTEDGGISTGGDATSTDAAAATTTGTGTSGNGTASGTTGAGASSGGTATPSVPSAPGVIPSPTTH